MHGFPKCILQNFTIQASHEARSFDVIVQSDLSFKRHVQAVSRSSFFLAPTTTQCPTFC